MESTETYPLQRRELMIAPVHRKRNLSPSVFQKQHTVLEQYIGDKKNGGLDLSLTSYMNIISQQITAFHIKGKTLKVLENLQDLGQGKESVVRHGNKNMIHKSKR